MMVPSGVHGDRMRSGNRGARGMSAARLAAMITIHEDLRDLGVQAQST
jgi:hypothetical protein